VSSHILAELGDYSDRMIIVDQGRIAGGESIALKEAGPARLRIVLASPRDGLKEFLESHGARVAQSGRNGARAALEGGAEARAALLTALVRQDFAISEFVEEDGRALEDVYFEQVRPPAAEAGKT